MAETQTETKTKAPKQKLTGKELVLARAARRTKKAAGRKKRSLKLKTDKEFAKPSSKAVRNARTTRKPPSVKRRAARSNS